MKDLIEYASQNKEAILDKIKTCPNGYYVAVYKGKFGDFYVEYFRQNSAVQVEYIGFGGRDKRASVKTVEYWIALHEYHNYQ